MAKVGPKSKFRMSQSGRYAGNWGQMYYENYNIFLTDILVNNVID